MSTKIAFFDFDGTLTRHDTFRTFAFHAVGKKKFLISLLKSSPYIFAWKLKMISNAQAKEKLFSNLYRSMAIEEFNNLCDSFINIINSDVRQDTLEILRQHQNLGHKIAIVTASVGNWIRPWAKVNNIDLVLATEAETNQQGLLTGRFSTPNCYGKEKAKRIKAKIPDLDILESWGYGDSEGDKYMLMLVTHPRKV